MYTFLLIMYFSSVLGQNSNIYPLCICVCCQHMNQMSITIGFQNLCQTIWGIFSNSTSESTLQIVGLPFPCSQVGDSAWPPRQVAYALFLSLQCPLVKHTVHSMWPITVLNTEHLAFPLSHWEDPFKPVSSSSNTLGVCLESCSSFPVSSGASLQICFLFPWHHGYQSSLLSTFQQHSRLSE